MYYVPLLYLQSIVCVCVLNDETTLNQFKFQIENFDGMEFRFKTYTFTNTKWNFIPVNVELVKIRTIFELTGGNDSKEPANIKSTVRSSIIAVFQFWKVNYENFVVLPSTRLYLNKKKTLPKTYFYYLKFSICSRSR